MPIMRKMNLINVHFWTYLTKIELEKGDYGVANAKEQVQITTCT